MLLDGLAGEPEFRARALTETFLLTSMDRASERPPSPGVRPADTWFAVSLTGMARPPANRRTVTAHVQILYPRHQSS